MVKYCETEKCRAYVPSSMKSSFFLPREHCSMLLSTKSDNPAVSLNKARGHSFN